MSRRVVVAAVSDSSLTARYVKLQRDPEKAIGMRPPSVPA